jgi:membrane protease YdiL (CAAX protease family)
VTASAAPQHLAPAPGSGVPRFLVGFLVLWAVLAGLAATDPALHRGPLVLVAVAVVAVVVSRGLERLPLRDAVRALGLGRPAPRAMAVSAVVSALVLLVWPVTTWLSGASIPLRPDWPLALVGVLALHGLAEELVWRGYVFGRLARGRSFRSAVGWSMPLIALTHVPVLVTAGPAVGAGAMLVAAVTSIPLSRLYVLGGGTVWAPALLHAAIDSFKLVVLPAAALAVYPLLIIGFSLAVPLLVLLVHNPSRKDVPR